MRNPEACQDVPNQGQGDLVLLDISTANAVVSSLGVPGMPWYPQILADQLTLSQPVGADYAHHISTGTFGFSDLPTALNVQWYLHKFPC